ncbi:MAG: hypothetical protein IJ518_06685 [Clostridia bacterium]|nr:hypothetical protein [Clostridia bacterium]
MQDIRCEECENYDYDEETGVYTCVMDLDMDEYERFLLSGRKQCPYYRVQDEYRIVRRQN